MGLLPLPSVAENQALFADAKARSERRAALEAQALKTAGDAQGSSSSVSSSHQTASSSLATQKKNEDTWEKTITKVNRGYFFNRNDPKVLESIAKAFRSR